MTAKSILSMNWAMGDAEYVREAQAQEFRGKRAAKKESDEICAWIKPFFSPAKWSEWVDAGPDDVKKFVRYARAEWLRIAREFEIKLSATDMAELRA